MNCGTSGTGGTGERVEKAGRAGRASRTGDCGTGREFLNSELGTSCKLAPAGVLGLLWLTKMNIIK